MLGFGRKNEKRAVTIHFIKEELKEYVAEEKGSELEITVTELYSILIGVIFHFLSINKKDKLIEYYTETYDPLEVDEVMEVANQVSTELKKITVNLINQKIFNRGKSFMAYSEYILEPLGLEKNEENTEFAFAIFDMADVMISDAIRKKLI